MSGSGINRRDALVLAGAGAVGASLTQISPADAVAPAAAGIPPMDKDGRDPPPDYPTPSFEVNERALLDH